MCGIVGTFGAPRKDLPEIVERMSNALIHRGPDDSGRFIAEERGIGLGHRRLSIIDLSPLGRQPMCNEDGTVWVTFNGEIYNFAQLRGRLEGAGHRFVSRTDTEVLVHGFEEYGTDLVTHLRGMFAFAIWDDRRRQLFVARDRLGIKPLYYFHSGGQFAFASELKALAAHPSVPREIDPSAVYDFLSYRYVPTPKTIYKDVFKLPPGHTLLLGDDGRPGTPRRYWDLRFTEDPAAPSEFKPSLVDAVDSHLVSDVPLGLFLSGGIDSSSVAAVTVRDLHRKADTFTVGFDCEAHSEAPYAREVARLLGTDHHEETVSLGNLDHALSKVVDTYDEPFGDGSAIPTLRLCDATRRSVKVALSGDGGDEILGGYGWYRRWTDWNRRRRWWSWIPRGVTDRALRAAPGAWKVRNLGRQLLLTPLEMYLREIGVFTRYEKQLLCDAGFADQFRDYDDVWQIRQFWRDDLPSLSAMQWVDLHTYLPDDILTKVDRASMAVSLEVRIPLLDHPLVEVASRLPLDSRWRGGKSKYILRHQLAEWMPPGLLDRPKQGFSSPFRHWLKPEDVRRRLLAGSLVRNSILDQKALARCHPRNLSGGKAWTLLVLDQWFTQRRT